MAADKDIHFSQKKIDESWKEQAAKVKGESPEVPKPETSKVFLNFLTSLGLQVLIHLGEISNPETQQHAVNLDAARDIIDLLLQIKVKSKGNLSAEEADFFQTFLPGLQLKFAQRV